jgi:hypothetical protein
MAAVVLAGRIAGIVVDEVVILNKIRVHSELVLFEVV